MARQPRLHPHLFDPNAAGSRPFTSPNAPPPGGFALPNRNRAQHAAHLLRQINAVANASDQRVASQKAEGLDAGFGITIEFVSSPDFELRFESLDLAKSGIELCAVTHLTDRTVRATVFVPDGKITHFLKRITAYRDKQSKPNKAGATRPKHEDLVASIADIRLAALEALWTDNPELLPPVDQLATFELWLRRSGVDHLVRLRENAERFGLRVSDEVVSFVERRIVLVHGTAQDIARSNEILGAIAEIRLAKTTAALFTRMPAEEQRRWSDDLLKRLRLPEADAPSVCLLDTGLNAAHPLLKPLTASDSLHSYIPQWNVDDRHGHGTWMAGIALYGDLTPVLASAHPVPVPHRLESVKMINPAAPHEPRLYGAVTAECAFRAETGPRRNRVFCMAVSTPDGRERGRPSSWSAALDDLASGRNDGHRRLIIVSAGNTDGRFRRNYPDANLTDSIHDPGQAWNALTVGGYTEKAIIDQAANPGWEPLAPAGDLSPSSCTSITWSDGKWPIKPDIVLEAGNMARHPDHADPDYTDDGLQLLTTSHNFTLSKPLMPFGDTSAATAIAAHLAARLWTKYPSLTPEAVRGLLVHSAQWTPAMLRRFQRTDGAVDYPSLLRCFGWGVPHAHSLLSSADNALTLIAQGTISPFHKDGNSIKPREMKLHSLPWPTDVLQSLGSTEVTLRVTLSYFVEPNPGERGWSSKYGYQSHVFALP